jgi:hypothetical protein
MTVMIAAVRKAARGVQRDFGELSTWTLVRTDL